MNDCAPQSVSVLVLNEYLYNNVDCSTAIYKPKLIQFYQTFCIFQKWKLIYAFLMPLHRLQNKACML